MGAEEEGGGVLGGGVEDKIGIFEKFVGENGKAAMHFGIGSSKGLGHFLGLIFIN